MYQCRYCKNFMDASELVYDRPGVYCRVYACPECKAIFETFLDNKGERLSYLDTWWRSAVRKEEAVSKAPEQSSTAHDLSDPQKRTTDQNSAKQPVKTAENSLPPNKPAHTSRVAAQTSDQARRVNLSEMPVGNILPPNKPAAAKAVTERPANKAKREKNRGRVNGQRGGVITSIPLK